MEIAIISAVAIALIWFVASLCYVVKQQTVYIIERFGKFIKASHAGLHIRLPFGIDKIAAKIPLRIQQTNLLVETKTEDNVFVKLSLAVQYCVSGDKVKDAYYSLQNPVEQIRSYVEDAIRSRIPMFKLDDAFAKKDDISTGVFDTVSAEMAAYGYKIVKTLVVSIDPDEEVKRSMNEINAAQRKRSAAIELAEADKVKIVVAAEAEKERAQLHGEGIANERKAIVDGLKYQFEELNGSKLTDSEIMSILLSEQYMDTLNEFARAGNTTILLPSSAGTGSQLQTEILSAISAAKFIGRHNPPIKPQENAAAENAGA